jgi:hypothetical protein
VRIRDVLAVLVGVVVVGAVGFAGWQFLGDSLDPAGGEADDPQEDAEETATAYLEAWDEGDLGAMRALVRDAPDDFEERHEQLIEALDPTSIDIEPGRLREPDEGRAVVPVTVGLELEELDEPVRWETELEVIRERSRWGVDWSLATLHPELRPSWGFATTSEALEREPVLAVDETPLAGGEAATLGFVPQFVEDADDVVEAFGEALPGSEDTAERQLSGDLNEDWFYPVVTVSRARADLAWRQLRRTPGIDPPRSDDRARVLLDAGFAEHVVGRVSVPTAEQLEEREELEPDDRIGQFGLEAVLEDQLVGSEVLRVGLRDLEADDDELAHTITEVQADPSEPVHTTLDIRVQRAIENTLGDLEDEAGAIVVVDGQDGAIRGSASRPLGGFNRAFSGMYPPGSTFKLVTAEAALEAGAELDDEVSCPAETTVGGLRVPNAGDRDLGTTTFDRAFAESCNTTFAQLGAELGAEALVEASERFGFDVDPLVPLTASGGSFPTPGDAAEEGAAAFGQARVEASPLHLASVAAAIVGGAWHQPYLLVDDGPAESRPLATGTPELLRELMLTAVEDGTGEAAAVDDEAIGGKTGTAQAGDVEHAWFIGTWESLGFAILVEEGGDGSEAAAPLAAELVTQLVELGEDGVDPAEPTEDEVDEEALQEAAEEAAEEAEVEVRDADEEEDTP